MAQSNVYSLNVVGYVNVTIPSGYSLIANPLNATDNTVSNLFSTANPLGATVYSWNGSGFVANTLDEFGGGWGNPALSLAPGVGFLIRNPGAQFTNTFVGEVLQGTLNNTPPSGYSLLASMVPQQGYLADTTSAGLGLTAGLGDTVYGWSGTGFVAINNDEFGGGWNTNVPPFTVDNAKGPLINVAQGFFYNNVAHTATWVRNFTVQ